MNSADMASLVPNPDDFLAFAAERQRNLLLRLLAPYHNSRETAVAQSNFFNRASDQENPPKYGRLKQKEVDEALMEAWGWLEGQGLLAKAAPNWVFVGKAGRDCLNAGSGKPQPGAEPGGPVVAVNEKLRKSVFEHCEKLGFERVKLDLFQYHGLRWVGGNAEQQEYAWQWYQAQEAKRASVAAKREDVVGVKPALWGVSINLNELWRRFRLRFKR
jgi:hypothetical protein